MESFWETIGKNALAIFTDQTFMQVVGGLLVAYITYSIKCVRGYLYKVCKNIAKNMVLKPGFNESCIATYTEINSDLAVLRTALSASRVSIYQFHNGDKFTLSSPIFKLTCSHENVSHGLVPDSKIMQYVLVSTILEFVAPLMESCAGHKGVSEVEFEDECKGFRMLKFRIAEMEYERFHHIMEQQGASSVYAAMLYAKDHKSPIGILCIQYTSPDDSVSDNLIVKNASYIADKVRKIEFCLDEDII